MGNNPPSPELHEKMLDELRDPVRHPIEATGGARTNLEQKYQRDAEERRKNRKSPQKRGGTRETRTSFED